MGVLVDGVVARMTDALEPLEAAGDPARYFLGTYLRTTRAIGAALDGGLFEDPEWVEEWDVVFADLYLDALDAHRRDPASAPRPWRIAFAADPGLHPVLHVLLGMNAHINFDLPQATAAVLPPVLDPALLDLRRRDHERVDEVLASRVGAEDVELGALAPLRLVDRALRPVNRAATRRFLTESRHRVWANTLALHEARASGDSDRRVAELDALSAARVADLLRPGPVLVRLAVRGFGVTLPPP